MKNIDERLTVLEDGVSCLKEFTDCMLRSTDYGKERSAKARVSTFPRINWKEGVLWITKTH